MKIQKTTPETKPLVSGIFVLIPHKTTKKVIYNKIAVTVQNMDSYERG